MTQLQPLRGKGAGLAMAIYGKSESLKLKLRKMYGSHISEVLHWGSKRLWLAQLG